MSGLMRFVETLFPGLLDTACQATALMLILFALARVFGKRRLVARYWLLVYCLAGIPILPVVSLIARDHRIAVFPAIEQPASAHFSSMSPEAFFGVTDPSAEKIAGRSPSQTTANASSAGRVVTESPSVMGAAPDPAAKVKAEASSINGGDSATAGQRSPVATHSAAQRARAQRTSTTASAFPWRGYIILAWLAVCTVLLLRLLFAAISIVRIRRSFSPASDAAVLELFEAAKKSVGLGTGVELRTGNGIASPVSVGILRPTILLPESLVREMPLEQLRPILLHELAHIRWGDYAVNILQRIAESVLFFHPLIWLINRWLRALREEICDNWVLDHCSNRTLYARALTELAGRSLCRPASRFAALGLFAHRALIRRRIERILAPGKRPATAFRVKTAVVLLLISLATVGSLSLTSLSARVVEEKGKAAANEDPQPAAVLEGEELKEVPFVKTIPRYMRYELPPLPVMFMDDGRAMVPAQRIWSDTGLDLAEGQVISVSAAGQVRGCNKPPSSWAFGPWGPEGTTSQEPGYEGNKACALIGKVESQGNKEEFYIGKELTFKAPLAGRFYLGVSDIFHMDNEAAFVAEVKIDGKRVDFKSVQAPEPSAGSNGGSSSLAAAEAGNPSVDLDSLPGQVMFKGTYQHFSRGQEYGSSTQWVKQDKDGAITAATKLRSSVYIARGDKENRIVEYKVVPEEEAGYRLEMSIRKGKVAYEQRMPGKEKEVRVLSVPEDHVFDPNSRPDPYCAANILLRAFDLKKGDIKQVNGYDWDDTGWGMATYSFRIAHNGKEEVKVRAGTFEANHIVLTQLSTGNTWYKKRAGHVTDFWVLDNGVIVRILRHREPYEVQLVEFQTSGVAEPKEPAAEEEPAAGPSPEPKVRILSQPGQVTDIPEYVGPARTEPEGGIRYAVRPSAFRDGERLYTDRTYTLQRVPEKYQGLTYIQTAQNDKTMQEGFELAFEVNAPVTVYVARDDRLTEKPAWLQAFEDTGDDFTSDDPYEPVYSLYAKSYPGGKIVLGPNCGVVMSCMYLVILEELGPSEAPAAPMPAPVTEAEGIKKVPFMKTIPRFERSELPPMPVLVMDDGRAIVPAQRIWSDTALDVDEGQTIAIAADGQVRGCHAPLGDWAMGPWGPEGTMSEGSEYYGNKVCALIGKVESDQRAEEFYIGKQLTFKAPLTGRLYLGVSDIFHIDNEGAFVVEVKIEGKRVDFKAGEPSKPAAVEEAPPPAARKFGRTAVVAADGSGDTTSIQQAIDGVDEGGTVYIKPGTYREHITISKPVMIEGVGRDLTRIEAATLKQREQTVVVSIESCRDVGLKGLTVACGTKLGEQSGLVLVEIQDADVSIEECNILWAQYGITITGSSNARIERCLVAGIWRTGIAIGRDASATVANSEVRNCYHRCITVRTKGDVKIENNIISGSAWHGVRYDHCSPTIVGNVIRNNARSGIYASGSGEARIINNLFLRNEMCGVSTWYRTDPLVRNNTFAENKRGGLEMDVTTRPIVENNIFFANETAARRFYTSDSKEPADSSQPPQLSHNLLWKNKNETPPPPRPWEEVMAEHNAKLAQLEAELANLKTRLADRHPEVVQKQMEIEAYKSMLKELEQAAAYKPPELSFSGTALRIDPLFVNADAADYNLRPDSPCRGAGKDGADIGARLTIPAEWQYPITPEEKLIIPDVESRDSGLWKTGEASPPLRVAERKPTPPTAKEPIEIYIEVTEEGKLVVAGADRTIEEADEILKQIVGEQPDVQIIVRAGRKAPYRNILTVLEACERANISKVSFTTVEREPKEEKREPSPTEPTARAEEAGFVFVDLKPCVNWGLTRLHGFAGNDLGLEPGKLRCGEIEFRISDGMVKLSGERFQEVPEKVEGIKVGLKLKRLHILHATGWGTGNFTVPEGTQIASYLVHYQDGSVAEIPVKYGVDVRDWWAWQSNLEGAGAKPAWTNETGRGRLYLTTWENPHPDKVVSTLDYSSAGTVCAPFLVAMTAETIGPAPAVEVKAAEDVEPQPKKEKRYEEAFLDLYQELGRNYPCFGLKGIDWKKVGEELLPQAKNVETDDEFGLLCMELVARLEDSHAYLMNGTAKVPAVKFPQWDPGFACLMDDRGKPVVYWVDTGGPAQAAGVKVGMTAVSTNGETAEEFMGRRMREVKKYSGYSSERYLRYHIAQWLGRQMDRGAMVNLEMRDVDGQTHTFKLPATLGVRYLPRLPVPISGISDSANVSWIMLDNDVGYIYVRRIRSDLIEKLDQALGQLKDARGLIVDVRGNSGGGFDSQRSHRNFSGGDTAEPQRPRFKGPIAMLIDARCISAGEGWASWFIANRRAKVFGETTAGASSRKEVYTLTNGLFKVQYPVKAYTGFLDRPIERRGLEPDVPLRQNASDLAAGRDTVLEAAKGYLLEQTPDYEAATQGVAPAEISTAPAAVAEAEKYSPPDFEGYFPDDPEGGKKLDGMGETGIFQSTLPDEELLEIVRKGLRRTTQRWILRALGNRYIWGKRPQNPKAIDIMYHATDGPDVSNAVYFGLSVVQDKSPSILRALVDICMRSDDPNVLDRIAWGTKSQRSEILPYLAPYLNASDEATQEKARIVERILKNELKAFGWAIEKARVRAEAEFTDRLPQIKEKLLHGDSETRSEALELITANAITLIMDDSFIEAWKACAKDPDPRIRNQVARTFGNRWIWSAREQKPEAIQLMLRLSRDEIRDVRYNAVYFGLSTVRDKSEEVVRRLLEIAMDDREWNMFSRIQWGLRESQAMAARILDDYMDRYKTDPQLALAAFQTYEEIVGKAPPHPERFEK